MLGAAQPPGSLRSRDVLCPGYARRWPEGLLGLSFTAHVFYPLVAQTGGGLGVVSI